MNFNSYNFECVFILANILMYWYSRLAKEYMGVKKSLSITKRGSVELTTITTNTNGSTLKLTEGLKSEEQFIKEKLGGCHRFLYL